MRKLIMGLAVSSAILTACNGEPELSMAASSNSVAVGESVSFTNGGDAKKAYNITWNFGDGGSANTWNASHAYAKAGVYTVTLSGTSKRGNKATSVTQEITVNKSDYDKLEDKREAQEVANDNWWTNAVGTWGFTSGKYVETECRPGGTNAEEVSNNADATKMTFTIVAGSGSHDNSSYRTNNNGEKNTWDFELIDDTHVFVSGFGMPYTPALLGNPANIHAEFSIPSGVYEYANTGTVITLTRVEEEERSYLEGNDQKYCVDTRTYTYTLTKK